MKLLYLSSLYPPDVGGGAELVLRAQVKAMSERGHSVTVLTVGRERQVVRDRLDGVDVIRVPYHNFYFQLQHKSPSRLRKMLWHLRDRNNEHMGAEAAKHAKAISPDLVCCHNITGWSISIWREISALGIPIVQVLHDQYLLCLNSNMFRAGHNCRTQCVDCQLMRITHRRESNQVTAVIGVSAYILDKVINAGYFSAVKIRSVLNNVSLSQMPNNQLTKTFASPVVFGFIGSLAENKGIEFLLETIVKNDLGDCRLVIAGKGEAVFEAYLRQKYADPRIEFLGYTSQEKFFSMVDLTIVPSLWNDTFPSVVFESIGHGVPVAASRRGGIPEMIQHGENGLLFDPDEEGALREILIKIIESPASLTSLARQCRLDAKKYFDVTGWVDSQERIFATCIGEHTRFPAKAI